ncbi:MAG: tRNA lysidine(34) synthetase TilS [Holosporales bacterium]|nr:tRNA lysidine(34) synthetase TilS [Holosporales bacterium]
MQKLLSGDNTVKSGEKVFVSALSGGADSMSLTLLINEWMHTNSGKLFTVTVDHSLRPESAEEAKTVGKWMKDYGISHHILKWDHGSILCGHKQVRARQARYDLLFDFCNKVEADYLLVAHTLDDQIETFFIRQEFHSGDYGLAGINAVVKPPQTRTVMIRPLLNVYKNELKSYLTSIRQKWIEDPSNLDKKCKRVRIRMEVAAKADKKLIWRRILALNESRQNLELAAENFISLHTSVKKFGYAVLPSNEFCKLDPCVQKHVMRRLLWSLGGKQYPASLDQLASIVAQLKNLVSRKKVNVSGCLVAQRKDYVHIMRELRGISDMKVVGNKFWDRRFLISANSPLNVTHAGLEKASELREFFGGGSMFVEGFGSLPVIKQGSETRRFSNPDTAIFRSMVNLTDEFVYLN